MSQIALRSILSMPTRFFNHFRRTDDVLMTELAEQQLPPPPPARQSSSYHTILPGPWAFVTSGYAITLVLMVCH